MRTGPAYPRNVGSPDRATRPVGVRRCSRRRFQAHSCWKELCRFCQYVRSVFARRPVPAGRPSVSFVSYLQGHIQRLLDARTPSRGTRRRPALITHFKRIQIATRRANGIWIRRTDLCWHRCQEVTRMDCGDGRIQNAFREPLLSFPPFRNPERRTWSELRPGNMPDAR